MHSQGACHLQQPTTHVTNTAEGYCTQTQLCMSAKSLPRQPAATPAANRQQTATHTQPGATRRMPMSIRPAPLAGRPTHLPARLPTANQASSATARCHGCRPPPTPPPARPLPCEPHASPWCPPAHAIAWSPAAPASRHLRQLKGAAPRRRTRLQPQASVHAPFSCASIPALMQSAPSTAITTHSRAGGHVSEHSKGGLH